MLVFCTAHAERFSISGNPARFVGLGIRAQLKGFTRPQAGEGFKHHLPAERFRTNVREHQCCHFMQCFRVMRHEIPAVLDGFGRTIPGAAEVQRILLNQIAAHSPQQGIAQRVQLHVHRPVTPAILGVLLPPSMVTVKLHQGQLTDRQLVPKFEQQQTIGGFQFQGATLTRLLLAVGITVFLVATDDFPDCDTGSFFLQFSNTDSRPPPVQFLAGVFEIFGFERAPSSPTAHFGPLKISS